MPTMRWQPVNVSLTMTGQVAIVQSVPAEAPHVRTTSGMKEECPPMMAAPSIRIDRTTSEPATDVPTGTSVAVAPSTEATTRASASVARSATSVPRPADGVGLEGPRAGPVAFGVPDVRVDVRLLARPVLLHVLVGRDLVRLGLEARQLVQLPGRLDRHRGARLVPPPGDAGQARRRAR